MKKTICISFSLLFTLFTFAQSLDEIKRDTRTYLWGEGTGATLNRADQEALASLIGQISVFVESQSSSDAREVQHGDFFQFEESFEASINTYSNATLRNTERIVISDEPSARVFRYIKRTEIDQIFVERENKIREFARYGEQACKESKPADALRYYYWALTLLRSHPNGNTITYTNSLGIENLLATWLHLQINNVFSDVSITLAEKHKMSNYWQYIVNIRYKDNPAVNFDFTYWTGRNYSGVNSAKNGMAAVEMMGEIQAEKLEFKAEYIFEGEAAIDQELRDVMQRIEPIPFRNNHYIVILSDTPTKESKPVTEPQTVSRKPAGNIRTITELTEKQWYVGIMDEFKQAIRSKNYESIGHLFTPEGYDIFQRILAYGNAVIVTEPEMDYFKSGDEVIVRSIPMQFRFPNNNRQFVEDIVIHFNSSKLINNITFGLDQIALNDVLAKDIWTQEARWVLINFLENYKTAFALKRVEYIESIFDDEALIIVGRIVERAPNRENPYLNNEVVRYNRYSKSQYIRNLRHAFSSTEFINIRFEDNIISKADRGGEVYGIQIKQDYFSTNYGDTGYLFLMVDVNEPDKPVIHVRTWQPQKNADGSIYGLGDF